MNQRSISLSVILYRGDGKIGHFFNQIVYSLLDTLICFQYIVPGDAKRWKILAFVLIDNKTESSVC